MKSTILGVPVEQYKKKINTDIVLITVLGIITVAVNILLTVFVSENTLIAFLFVNILLDIIVFCFIYFWISVRILPYKKLYKIAIRSSIGESLKGEVVSVTEQTETVNGLECYELTLNAKGIRKIFIAKEGAIYKDLSGIVELKMVDNIVVEAEILS